MNNETTLETQSDAAIRDALERWRSAVTARDIDGIMAHYAADILSFDAVAQLQFSGAEAYRRHWQACMEMCKGPMIFEIHQLSLSVRDDIAFGHYLTRCGGVENGQEKTSWMRATVCLHEIGGRWLIVHEHFSVPFDMQNGKALFDLKP
ncbi:MAG TPA: nuclear transport factor 2 family protein [Oxalicibacterium sp.]|nr:nuclear transport factor 2 family protein [Oxalicibacterium sp.]